MSVHFKIRCRLMLSFKSAPEVRRRVLRDQ